MPPPIQDSVKAMVYCSNSDIMAQINLNSLDLDSDISISFAQSLESICCLLSKAAPIKYHTPGIYGVDAEPVCFRPGVTLFCPLCVYLFSKGCQLCYYDVNHNNSRWLLSYLTTHHV